MYDRTDRILIKNYYKYLIPALMIGIAAIALVLVLLVKVEPVYVILGAMPAGVIYAWCQLGKKPLPAKGGAEK